ncbi:hypothetical protein NDU88_000036 [Pleurodeles waltl]|uniref:Uncharacterized protein n=1 Tax=Pleurodeles waltl TaxID=8319 RepID=A0AAV7VUY0_PLEWA|nr:hypothetical protein NDU88_000036 [Pleurodeles waltl]
MESTLPQRIRSGQRSPPRGPHVSLIEALLCDGGRGRDGEGVGAVEEAIAGHWLEPFCGFERGGWMNCHVCLG